jgi:hypothetical protein
LGRSSSFSSQIHGLVGSIFFYVLRRIDQIWPVLETISTTTTMTSDGPKFAFSQLNLTQDQYDSAIAVLRRFRADFVGVLKYLAVAESLGENSTRLDPSNDLLALAVPRSHDRHIRDSITS